ncbi:hypothetical protein AX766_13920 [Flavobacterium covae]|nr:hypothetical protein AX766_13920 [Flavobacterium covae]OWP81381.1 hypothetical protein BWK63_05835 [Flavobacterium covae]POR20951.1 hypothetical protein BWK57_11865 [Flavobacterium columnare]
MIKWEHFIDYYCEYKYGYGFELEDTIKINIDNNLFKIYSFKFDTFIINKKKGLECEFKEAILNGKLNKTNIFEIKK